MKSNGKIIYKFTIIAKYKMDGCKPFYVGQYTGKRFDLYWGSGSIWTDLIKRLKNDFPNCWKKLIKREILYQGDCTQKTLDKLEEIYIRRERSLKGDNLGGCNILSGTANGFGSGSPAKDPFVRKKMKEAMSKRLASGWRPISIPHTEEQNKNHSKQMKEYYKTHDVWNKGSKIEDKTKHPMYGKRHSEESRRKMREHHADFSGKNNPMYGVRLCGEKNPAFGKIWVNNGVENRYINKDSQIPEGFAKGQIRRKAI